MIDEDLYQQATDELNSDKRRPHIWARACALASDDHDEARYLYTNLRVEELIAEREASGASHSANDADSPDHQHDATLALEPLDLDDDIPESISAPSGIDLNRTQKEILSLDAEMLENNELIDSIERKSFEEKFDANEETDFTGDQSQEAYSEDFLDETINLTSELDGTAVFELDRSDATEFDSDDLGDDLVGKDSAALSDEAEDDELEALLGGIYQGSSPPPPTDPLADDDTGAAMTLDFSDVTGSHAELDKSLDESLEGELAPEDENRGLQHYSPADLKDTPRNETDRLAQELERQADELPGQRSDIVSVNDDFKKDEEPSAADEDVISLEDKHDIISGDTFEEEAERDIAESLRRKQASAAAREAASVDSQAHHDLDDNEPDDAHVPGRDTTAAPDLPAAAAMAAAGVVAASHATGRSSVQELPVDLTEQHTGTRYSVFRRGVEAQAVKNGVSWTALFLTLPFLVYRHLFGTALVYAVMWLILLAGLVISGLAWLDAGTAANSIVKATTAGFALLALIGLLYLPFRYGNQWREDKLEQRGFERVAWVRASSPGKAISAARRASTLD